MAPVTLDRRNFLRTTGLGALALGSGLAVGATGANAAEPKELPTVWQQQIEFYFCGPTAAAIAISAKGEAPSQQDLAAQLGTAPDTGTNFGAMAPVLTDHLPGATYREHNMIGQDTANDADADLLWERATKNVDGGFATVCNWVVVPGDYPNWGGNQSTIYHFTTIDGYDPDARTLRISDPAGATLSPDLPHQYWLPVKQVAIYCAGRGYFW